MSPLASTGQHSYNHSSGAYGRDGAPASNFMSTPPHALRLASPPRPNIAQSERPLPPVDRFSPRPDAGACTPPSQSNPFISPYDPKPSPPKAAFLETVSVNDHHSDSYSSHGLIHGETEKAYEKEGFYRPVARLEDLKRPSSNEDSSAWLKKQAQAGSKFKTATWVVAIVSLIIIASLVAKIITTKSPTLPSPTPLKWANGASSVPTFGVNATSRTDQSQLPNSSNNPKISSSPSTTSRRRRSLNLLD